MMSNSPAHTRVLHIITRLNVGGPAQNVTFLAERLGGSGLPTSVVAGSLSRGEGNMSSLAAGRGVAVTFMPVLGNDRGLLSDLGALWQLYHLIRRRRPTIVHLHLLKARLLGGMAARLAGVPVVLETLHGHLLTGYYGSLKERLLLGIERLIGRRLVDGVLALSESQRADLIHRRIAAPDKIHVVPYGLECQRFLATPRGAGGLRQELGLNDSTLLVGAVGRLVPIKGYSLLLGAIHTLSRTPEGSLRLILVGDGPLRPELEDEAERLGIRHLVLFLGWRGDVDRVYADVDVLVQPSLNEGTPFTLMEAMAAGTAVVATGVGGVPDLVEDGRSGLLVPPGDGAAIAEAILKLWRDPELRHDMGEAARRRVHVRHSIEESVAQTAALYFRLMTIVIARMGRRAPTQQEATHS